MGRIKDYLHDLEGLWMSPIKEEQREYNKSRCLNPRDGSDWRREIL